MSQIPIIQFKKMEDLLLRLGFQAAQRKENHVFYRHADGRTTTLPNNPWRDLAKPLVREILREIQLTPEQLREELEKKASPQV